MANYIWVLEELLGGLRRVRASFPDGWLWRPDNIAIADAGLSAFSLFIMQTESFLAHQRRMEHVRYASNCKTLFGIETIPIDNHIRELPDPAPPKLLESCFGHTLEQMRQYRGIKDFQRLGRWVLIALDGSEYFSSEKRGCPRCLPRKRSNGKTEDYHTLLAATLVAPGHNRVLPLMPEFITPRTRFIMASTGLVFDVDAPHPGVAEDATTQRLAYSASKIAAESELRNSGLNWSILHLGFVYGKGMD